METSLHYIYLFQAIHLNYSLFVLHSSLINCLERIREADRHEFLELPVALIVLALGTIIKSRIEEDVGGDVTVELEGNRILPLYFRTLVGGISPQSGLPLDVLRYLPGQVKRAFRTVIHQAVLTLVQTISCSQRLTAHILPVDR